MTHLMGWCATHGIPDQFHKHCLGEFVSELGVTIRCGCPNHEWPDDEETA